MGKWGNQDVRIDPQAGVHPSVQVGEGTVVWGLARIHEGVTLGDQCSVGELTYIGQGSHIGARTRIGAQVHITDHMEVGQGCFISPMVTFSNDKNPIVNNPLFKRQSPIVEDDVSIGVNATILPGVRLGRGCTVGAGAVVTKDVSPFTTVIGNPARPLIPVTSWADTHDSTRWHLDYQLQEFKE